MSVEISHRPTDVGSAMGVLLALVASMTAVTASGIAGAAGLLGLVVLVAGILLPRPGLVDLGALGLLTGVILGGWAGMTPLLLVVGTVGAVLAWDLVHNAASHGRQVGGDASTVPAEAAHAAGSAAAGTMAAAAVIAGYTVATGGYSTTAVALLIVASLAIVLALYR